MVLKVKEKQMRLQEQIVMNKERSDEFFNSIFVKPLCMISVMSYLFEGFYLRKNIEISTFWEQIYEIFSKPSGYKYFIRSLEEWDYILDLLREYPIESNNDDDIWEVFRKNPLFTIREAEVIYILETELRKLVKN